MLNTHGRGKELITEEKEKKTKALPAIAGLAQLHPSPPNVHLHTPIAKIEAIRGTYRGQEEERFIPTRRPVTNADPSKSVSSWLILFNRYSVKRDEIMEIISIKKALKPNITQPHSAEGRSARETYPIALSVLILS